MNSKHRRTLAAIFTDPVPASVEWAAIESLLVAVGCELVEGSGSRVRFVRGGAVASFHRPHPGRRRRSDIRCAMRREFLILIGVSMKAMVYKGYAARVEFVAEDAVFAGRIAGISDVVGFHATSVPELIAAFHEAVDDYLDTCAKDRQGAAARLQRQPDAAGHAADPCRRRASAADALGKSLNQWSEEVLAEAAGRVVGG